MENKEKIKFMNYLKCCMEDCDMNKTYENPKTDYQKINEIIKDLEQKELLETELKLEKDKVKYVMGQLEKQDKILHIFKNNIKLVDYKGNGSTQAYKIIIEDKFTVKEENDMTYRNLDFDAIKEWSNGK